MRNVYHNQIFYPEHSDDLEKLVNIESGNIQSRAIIIPHQDLRLSYGLYNKAFSFFKNPKKIIILSPLHNASLNQDSKFMLLEDKETGVSTPLGKVKLASHDFLPDGSYYSKEEFSSELPLLYIAKYYCDAEVSIIYLNIHRSRDLKEALNLMKKIIDKETFFIISSNLSSSMNKKEEELDLILNPNSALFENYTKNKTGICASAGIEMVNRLIEGNWRLISCNPNDKKVIHAAFYREENE